MKSNESKPDTTNFSHFNHPKFMSELRKVFGDRLIPCTMVSYFGLISYHKLCKIIPEI